jgi:hypothetical protein
VYSSSYITRVIRSRRMRWAGHVTRLGEIVYSYKILVGRSEGKVTLGRPKRRREDNGS